MNNEENNELIERIMLVSQMKEGTDEAFLEILRSARSLKMWLGANNNFRCISIYRYSRFLLIYAEHSGTFSQLANFWNESIQEFLSPWPGAFQERYEI